MTSGAGQATPEGRKFLRFVVSGALAAAVTYTSRFGWSMLMPFEAAVVAAHASGMGVAFVLMRQWAFQAQGRPWRAQVPAFLLVNAVAVLVTLVVGSLLARWVLPALGLRGSVEALAHAGGIAVSLVTSWLGHRHGSFRS